MIMKSFLHVPGDFEKTLRLRRAAAAGLLLVGGAALFSYFLLVPGSNLPDFARGFYLGAGSGIMLGALILLVRAQYLLSRPEARKKARVREEDEREKAILNQSFQTAGMICFFLSAAALFVVLPFSFAAFNALLGAMVVYCVSFLLANAYYTRTL